MEAESVLPYSKKVVLSYTLQDTVRNQILASLVNQRIPKKAGRKK